METRERRLERFEDLDAWQQARALVKSIYELTRIRPLSRDFGVTGQIQRAAVSIMSNVAEGFERTHIQEKLQFNSVARSCSAEVRSLLFVIEDNYSESAKPAALLRADVVRTGQVITGLVHSTEGRRGLLGILFSVF